MILPGLILTDAEGGQVLFFEGNFIKYGHFHPKFKHKVVKKKKSTYLIDHQSSSQALTVGFPTLKASNHGLLMMMAEYMK